jgi:manganese oxidase
MQMLAVVVSWLVAAGGGAPGADGSDLPGSPELAGYEDYREGVGHVGADGIFRAALEVRSARWRPWGDDGPELPAHVFAVEGEEPRVPGPKLRMRVGTPVALTLRNTLSDTVVVRGLRNRGQELPPGAPQALLAVLPFQGDSVVVAPGEAAKVHFTPTVPGDFFYFGKVVEGGWSATSQPLFGASAADRALMGLLVVDGADEVRDPEERFFLISHWADSEDPSTFLPSARFLMNGRGWPHTERLEYAQGDTVRWRVVNQSGAFHPMHLHGFYFEVTSWTSQTGAPFIPPSQTPTEPVLAVTWPLQVTAAMRMEWVAHEPGNWLFHCHLMRHMSWVQAPSFAEPGAVGPGRHGHHAPEGAEGTDLLGGMVLGVTVVPPEGWRQPEEAPRRRLDLHVTMREGVFGGEPAYAFVLQEGDRPPAPDSVRWPGSLLSLVRGEPTEIVVHNHADVALGVHWHGLELESRADGVPGWSGHPGETVPAVAPGERLAVRMTPPRAGTFMYHVHSEPGHQLAQGLYGPFLVLEEPGGRDEERDRIYLMGALGAGDDPPPALNGRHQPPPEEFRVGETYRLRFMQISPDENKVLRLLDPDGEPVLWTLVERDGVPVPSVRAVPAPAVFPFVDVGTTMDLLWTPEVPGDHLLEITTEYDAGLPAFPREAPPDHRMRVTFRVRR